MSIWNAASTTVTTSLNVVTTTAVTVDKGVMSAYHAANVLESKARDWSEDSIHSSTLNRDTRRAILEQEHDLNIAERQLAFAKRLSSNPELKAIYERQRANRMEASKVTSIAAE